MNTGDESLARTPVNLIERRNGMHSLMKTFKRTINSIDSIGSTTVFVGDSFGLHHSAYRFQFDLPCARVKREGHCCRSGMRLLSADYKFTEGPAVDAKGCFLHRPTE